MAKRKSKLKSEGMDLNDKMFGPGGKALFYINKGLFSDPFLADLPQNTSSHIKSHWAESSRATKILPDLLVKWKEKADFFDSMSEAQIEEHWIRPVFKMLGWEYEVQDRTKKWGKDEIPDYSLFSSNDDYLKAKKSKTDEAYFEYVTAVADAKAMNIPLDGSKLTKSNPSYQIVWYLTVTNKTWGVLTDGRFWRLYCVDSKNKYTSFYEVNLESLILEQDVELFKYFERFFCVEAFGKQIKHEQSFLNTIFKNGEKYTEDVELELRERAFNIVKKIANGYFMESPIELSSRADEVYQHSLYLLFRLMFVLNAEAKGLLKIDRQNDYYIYSLRAVTADLKDQYERGVKWSTIKKTYVHLFNVLFPLLKNGDKSIGIFGFGQEIFSGIDQDFFTKYKISDSALNEVLLDLCFTNNNDELKFIDYKKLNIDHMGSIFEGMLEHKLVFDPKNKCLTFVESMKEKKDSGSFYTPDYMVDYIVEKTLSELIEDMSIEEIFKLKIMDPAMGSGHFLLGAVKYLENEVQERIHKLGKKSKIDPSIVRSKLMYNCVLGSDINELAVELAKFSLWIYAANENEKLESLNNNIFEADTLLKLNNNFGDSISAFVGNPPYKIEYQDSYKKTLSNRFATFSITQNVYACFIEKVLMFTDKKKQPFGFIIPNTFITGANFSVLRKLIENHGTCINVVDFGSRRVFDNADVYTSVLFSHNSDASKVNLAKLPSSVDFNKVKLIKFESVEISNPDGWVLSSPCEKYFALPRVKDLYEVKDVGFNYWSEGRGKTRGGSIGDRVFYEGKKKSKSDLPYIKGRDIEKFKVNFANRWLHEGWESLLGENDTFRFSPMYFEQEERIVYRQTSSSIIAAMAGKRVYNDKTVHLLKPIADLIPLKFMLGLMNSSLFTEMYRHLVDEEGQAFAQVKTVKVKELPIVIPSSKAQRELCDKIISLVNDSLKGEFSASKQLELDGLVTILYDDAIKNPDASASEIKVAIDQANAVKDKAKKLDKKHVKRSKSA